MLIWLKSADISLIAQFDIRLNRGDSVKENGSETMLCSIELARLQSRTD